MQSLVITANSKSDLEILRAVARKLGLATFELSERDKRLLARRKMNELAGKTPKINISEKEILQIVEDVRAEYHPC
ncbi:MAG: hypothetical protein IPJ82_10930 [Lewinellaceae bacterium]|nr:hypothetical protein [Lewinellaceae bacterium]